MLRYFNEVFESLVQNGGTLGEKKLGQKCNTNSLRWKDRLHYLRVNN